MADQAAEIRFLANVDEFEKNVKRMENKVGRAANRIAAKFDRFGRNMEQSGIRLTAAVTAPLVALGIRSFHAQKQFGDNINKMNTLVGIQRTQLDAWRTDFHRIGNQTAKTMGEMAEGMFFVTSAGLRGSTALTALEASAKGSAIGLGETNVVADAATSIMNAYGAENISAAEAVGQLVATVKEGKAEADSIAGSIGNVIPLAAELGIEFHEIGGAIASLTRQGNQAPVAIAQMSGVLSKLLKPTEQGKKELAALGLSVDGLRKSVADDGLLETLTMLRAKFGDNSEGLARLFEDIQAVRAVFALTGKSADITREIFDNLANSGVKNLDEAFKKLEQTDEFKIDRAATRMDNRMTRLGGLVLPMVADVMDRVSLVVERLAAELDALSEEQQDSILKWVAIGAAVGPLMIVLGAVSTSIAGVIRATALLSGVFSKTLRFALVGSAKLLGNFAKAIRFVAGGVVNFVRTLVIAFGGVPLAIGLAIAAAITTVLVFRNTIKEIFSTLWKIVSGPFNAGFQNYIVRPQIQAMNALIDKLPEAITKRLGLKKIKVPPIIDAADAGELWQEGWARAKEQAVQDASDAKQFVTETITAMKNRIAGALPDGLVGEIAGDFDALTAKMEKIFAPMSDATPTGPSNSKVLGQQFKGTSEQAAEAAADIKGEFRDAALDSAKQFENMNIRIEDGWRGVGDRVVDIFAGIANSIINVAFRPLTNALSQVANSVIGGLFPAFGGGASTGAASAGGGGYIPGKAGGGRAQPFTLTEVNERGGKKKREFIFPERPMTVMNNMDSEGLMRRATGGGDVNVNVQAQTPPPIVNVITNGNNQVQTKRRRGGGMREIIDVIVGSSADDIDNGGTLAESLERNYGLSKVGV